MPLDPASLCVGGVIGCAASIAAAALQQHATRPNLEVRDGPREDSPRGYSFYHVRVSNSPPIRPWTARNPALHCRAELDLFHADGNRAIPETITARWPSHPEPLDPTSHTFSPPLWVQAESFDVYVHAPQNLNVTIKYDGEDDCYLFSNFSYLHRDWRRPAWRVPLGRFRLRVTLLYSVGRREFWFTLHNHGSRREDLLVTFGVR